MGQSPSKKMSRTRSRELSTSELSDNLAATHLNPTIRTEGFSPVTPDSTPARTRKAGKSDRTGSVSSFNSATGRQPDLPGSPAIPTTTTILATSPNTLGSLRSSILGTSPPPSSLPARPSSPLASPFAAHQESLSPGAALTTTMSRSSATGVLDVDNMIGRLLEAGYSGKVTKSPPLKNAEIASVCAAAREVFLSQPTLIELSPPVKIVGDVHGQVSRYRCLAYSSMPT